MLICALKNKLLHNNWFFLKYCDRICFFLWFFDTLIFHSRTTFCFPYMVTRGIPQSSSKSVAWDEQITEQIRTHQSNFPQFPHCSETQGLLVGMGRRNHGRKSGPKRIYKKAKMTRLKGLGPWEPVCWLRLQPELKSLISLNKTITILPFCFILSFRSNDNKVITN